MQSLDLDVLENALAWRRAGRRAWLVTVAQTFGASPRPPGSLLAMRDDGILVGSVSGGCIEDDLVARREEFAGRIPRFVSYGVTGEEARRFGLPCGGKLEVMVEAEVAVADLEALLEHIGSGKVIARVVDVATGAWSFAPAQPTDECERGAARFASIHGPRWRMLIIGASEIAHYLAEVATTVDYRVFVCDPREEYRLAWRVPGATFVDGMPDDAVAALKPDGHTVILAVSHDPKLDDMALLEALKSEAFYVGAVGSRPTSAERRKRLSAFDLSAREIARLRGPVGLAIGSRTPPEIAVAILADLIANRNGVMLGRVDLPGLAPARLIRGLLLCGGAGTRFGGAKLLATTPGDSVPIGVRAARSLLAGAGNAFAVVRAGDATLSRALQEAGCEVLESTDSTRGLGASIAAGVKASRDAQGWIIALADMPFIRPATHRAVAAALARGAKLASAFDATGRRGHPVGFSADLFADLAALDGDEGARSVIERHRAWLEVVRVDDPGIFVDIDTPGDLAAG